MTNRTLQFLGLAYGNSAVTITATIDNVVVYNNTVATLNEPLVDDGTHWTTTNQLFTVENSDQFPIEFAGSRTMSVSVTGGEGIILAHVLSNYMEPLVPIPIISIMHNASISGTALTFDSVTGNVTAGMKLYGSNSAGYAGRVAENTIIVSGSENNWIVNNSQTVDNITINGVVLEPGNATTFVNCYNSTPTNSEGTRDCRSSVVIDGVAQVPDIVAKSQGIWTWQVNNGSTLVCDLNVSLGNVA
jgi:hypothetical protein